VLAVPEVAPDFTLERSGGGSLTLSEQLAQGPVVLVFFQRGGG
jgi:peroxiredoxin